MTTDIQTAPPQSASRSESSSGFRFTLMELSGSFGDLGTFIPLTVAMALTSGMDAGTMLFFAGLFNITTGLLFRLPIPVQPMKAIAAAAIAERLLPAEIAVAGLIVGGIVFLIGVTGWIDKVERIIPRSIVRGIQLGIGLKLALTGLTFIGQTDWLGYDSILTGAIALAGLLLVSRLKKFPSALIVFLVGLFLTTVLMPDIVQLTGFGLPQFTLTSIDSTLVINGLTRGALPQLPLTLLNSVIAVCALSGDLFTKKRVSTKAMAVSVGSMNLLSCWFGAMPMCHGSGGLAGQYRFGARTGGSVIMLGSIKVFIGLLLGVSTMQVLHFYPNSILGVMLLFAAYELARPAYEYIRKPDRWIVLITATGIVAINTAVGFVIGILTFLIIRARIASR